MKGDTMKQATANNPTFTFVPLSKIPSRRKGRTAIDLKLQEKADILSDHPDCGVSFEQFGWTLSQVQTVKSRCREFGLIVKTTTDTEGKIKNAWLVKPTIMPPVQTRKRS